MSLKDEVAALNIVGGGNRVENIIAMLDAEERKELIEMLDNHIYTGRAISRALSARGPAFAVSERTIQRYRQDREQV